MRPEELTHLIAQGPVRIRTNNGDTVDIPNAEMATVSDISAACWCATKTDGSAIAILP